MTSPRPRRRHPAQASRTLATGLSAATLLGIVAVLGATPAAGGPQGSPAVTRPTVTVVRIPDTGTGGRRAQPSQAGRAPDTTTRPS